MKILKVCYRIWVLSQTLQTHARNERFFIHFTCSEMNRFQARVLMILCKHFFLKIDHWNSLFDTNFDETNRSIHVSVILHSRDLLNLLLDCKYDGPHYYFSLLISKYAIETKCSFWAVSEFSLASMKQLYTIILT